MPLGRRWSWLGLAALGACIQPAAYPCEQDVQCDLAEGGICQPVGYCAYPDDGCAGDLRFESEAPAPFGGVCLADVETDGTDTEGSSDGTSTSTTDSGGCGDPLLECCEPDDACDGPWVCTGTHCACTLDMVSGDVHSCWFRLDGIIECWGGNDRGELGRTDPSESLPDPAPLEGVGSVEVVSASAREHTCIVTSTGDVWCWGDNTFEQSDPNESLSRADPPRIVASAGDGRGWTPRVVGVGPRHTCVAGDGRIACWGNNDAGQLGYTGASAQEVDTSGMVGEPQALGGGFAHTCVLTSDAASEADHVYCWGGDDTGQLGGGAGDQSTSTPVEVDLPGARIFDLSASELHTCAVVGPDESGSDPGNGRNIVCWGNNAFGQAVGPNATATIESPTAVTGLDDGPWVRVDAAPEHTCASSDDSTAYCWGGNSAGRIDPTGGGDSLGPTEIPLFEAEGRRVLSAHPGKFHTCALTSDGSLACWGCGGRGQLGPNLSSCAAEGGGGFGDLDPACG